MAKSKSFFGLRRGSTKTLTFQVFNGQQITKDRVEAVKNPRTQSQMVQRMVIATATAGYQAMRDICDHSFEGVSFGLNSMSRFVSENIRRINADIKNAAGHFSYNPYQDRQLYASPFILAQGSLKSLDNVVEFSQSNGFVDCSLNWPSGIAATDKVPDLFNALGIKVGDMLTFCFIFNSATGNAYRFGWCRLTVKAAPNMELEDAEWADVFDFESNYIFNSCYTNNLAIKCVVEIPGANGDSAFGTMIHSRQANGKWLRSNAAINFYENYVNAPSAAEAFSTYPVGTDYILNGSGRNIIPQPTPPPTIDYLFVADGTDETGDVNSYIFAWMSNGSLKVLVTQNGHLILDDFTESDKMPLNRMVDYLNGSLTVNLIEQVSIEYNGKVIQYTDLHYYSEAVDFAKENSKYNAFFMVDVGQVAIILNQDGNRYLVVTEVIDDEVRLPTNAGGNFEDISLPVGSALGSIDTTQLQVSINPQSTAVVPIQQIEEELGYSFIPWVARTNGFDNAVNARLFPLLNYDL